MDSTNIVATKLKSRKTLIILVILLLLLISLIILLGGRQSSSRQAEHQIIEPQVPLSTSVLGTQITELPVENAPDVDGIAPEQADNLDSEPTQQQSPDTLDTNSKLSLADAVSMQVSSSGKHLLFLIAEPSPQANAVQWRQAILPPVYAQEAETLTLTVTDSNLNPIATIDNKQITDARFSNDQIIYYQQDYPAGVYKYDINSAQSQLIVTTDDATSLRNIELVDNDRYFFIQPVTGKIGFAKLGENQQQLIDQKILPLGNYQRQSAYKFAKISSDGQHLAIYDLSSDDQGRNRLIILPTAATSLDDALAQAVVTIPATSYELAENIFNWNVDDKVLYSKFAGVLFNVEQNKVLHENESSNQSAFFVDSDLISIADLTNSDTVEVTTNNSTDLIDFAASQLEWLDEHNLILVIGQGLYHYNAVEKQLSAVTNAKDNYQIWSRNNETLYIKNSSGVLAVSRNES